MPTFQWMHEITQTIQSDGVYALGNHGRYYFLFGSNFAAILFKVLISDVMTNLIGNGKRHGGIV